VLPFTGDVMTQAAGSVARLVISTVSDAPARPRNPMAISFVPGRIATGTSVTSDRSRGPNTTRPFSDTTAAFAPSLLTRSTSVPVTASAWNVCRSKTGRPVEVWVTGPNSVGVGSGSSTGVTGVAMSTRISAAVSARL
jgi:hypothetical protein